MLALLSAGHAQADTLRLRGGERLIGTIVAEEAGRVVIESQTLGRIEVVRDRIEQIERSELKAATDTNRPPTVTARSLPTFNIFRPWLSATALTNATFDWIEIKTGEWLKGRLKSVQDNKLEFDSEEFDFVEYDWDDVHQLYSPRINEVLFDGKQIVQGSVYANRQEILMDDGGGPRAFSRSNLVSMTPGGPREIYFWSGKIAAGLSLSSGNTEQSEYNFSANLARRTPETRFNLDLQGNYAALDRVQTANNQRGTTYFDYWLSRRLYLRLPFADYVHDPFQNVAHRVTLGAGVGYQVFAQPKLRWELSVGPAYQHTWYDSVQAGEPDSEGNLAGLVGSEIEFKLSQHIDFTSKYQLILVGEEAGGYTHHWQSTLEVDLTKSLELDISFNWDRVSRPATGANGETPKPDDLRTSVSLGIKF